MHEEPRGGDPPVGEIQLLAAQFGGRSVAGRLSRRGEQDGALAGGRIEHRGARPDTRQLAHQRGDLRRRAGFGTPGGRFRGASQHLLEHGDRTIGRAGLVEPAEQFGEHRGADIDAVERFDEQAGERAVRTLDPLGLAGERRHRIGGIDERRPSGRRRVDPAHAVDEDAVEEHEGTEVAACGGADVAGVERLDGLAPTTTPVTEVCARRPERPAS